MLLSKRLFLLLWSNKTRVTMKKTILAISAICLFGISCQNESSHDDGHAHASMILEDKFNNNCETVRRYLDALQTETADYSMFAKDFYRLNTAFLAKDDNISLNDFIDARTDFWANYNAEMISEPVLLPGVFGETGEPNGSVRHYSEWRLTSKGADSKEPKEATIKLYESFDFNDEGKISINMVYGDFSAMFQYLNS